MQPRLLPEYTKCSYNASAYFPSTTKVIFVAFKVLQTEKIKNLRKIFH